MQKLQKQVENQTLVWKTTMGYLLNWKTYNVADFESKFLKCVIFLTKK